MPSLPEIHSFACYYGRSRLRELRRFSLVILQPDAYNRDDIAYLAGRGTVALAYLSLGETRQYAPEASWYLRDAGNQLLSNPAWQTFYVDPRDPGWQRQVLDVQIPPLLAEGRFAGLFLDTLDGLDRFPETRGGTVALIHAIRTAYPEVVLVANRGFTILAEIAADLDAVMFESFSTYYRAGAYGAWERDDLDMTTSQAHWLNYLRLSHPFQVLALDYAPPRSRRLAQYAARRARSFSFVPYVGSFDLSDLRRP